MRWRKSSFVGILEDNSRITIGFPFWCVTLVFLLISRNRWRCHVNPNDWHLQLTKTLTILQVMSDKSSTKSRHQPYLFWDAAADFRSVWGYWTSKTNFKTETKYTSNHSRKCCSNDPNFCSSRSPNFNKPFKYFLPEKISTKNSQKYRIWTLSFSIHLLWPG